ncbi:hypothetical protein BJV78DRAFT_633710 [Lactifluus subvellereus]|nr:hypothetical protein BJV78DRAFT_633710 [Lactifluus subvellereus]
MESSVGHSLIQHTARRLIHTPRPQQIRIFYHTPVPNRALARNVACARSGCDRHHHRRGEPFRVQRHERDSPHARATYRRSSSSSVHPFLTSSDARTTNKINGCPECAPDAAHDVLEHTQPNTPNELTARATPKIRRAGRGNSRPLKTGSKLSSALHINPCSQRSTSRRHRQTLRQHR